MSTPCITSDAVEQIVSAIKSALRQNAEYNNSHNKPGYLDAVAAANYLGISPRQFDMGPARELPCHRINKRGKRYYRPEDLDAYVECHREAPIDGDEVRSIIRRIVSADNQKAGAQ
jgi:hypothetical protein